MTRERERDIDRERERKRDSQVFQNTPNTPSCSHHHRLRRRRLHRRRFRSLEAGQHRLSNEMIGEV